MPLRVVGAAAMLRDVQPNHLLCRSAAQDASLPEGEEEGAHEADGPGGDAEDGNELTRQQVAATARVESAVASGSDSLAVDLLGVGLGGQQPGDEDTPHAAGAVHGRRLQRVIDAKLADGGDGSEEDQRAECARDDGGPGLQDSAARRDGDQATEQPVADVEEVPHAGAAELEDQRGNTACARGKGGGHSHAADHLRLDGAVDLQHGARVEAIPAKPEAECAKHNQRRGVARHVLHNAVLVKAAHARADEGGAHEAREAAGHVHHAAARKVKQAGAEQGARAERRQPSGLGPCPVSHGGVHKGAQEGAVAKVGPEVGAFRHGARDDGSGGGHECPLAQEVVPVSVAGGEFAQRKVGGADEWVGGGPVGKRKPKHVEAQGADARVHHILHQNIHGVLGTNCASAKHREAGLHEENQVGREEQVCGVEALRHAGQREPINMLRAGQGGEQPRLGGVDGAELHQRIGNDACRATGWEAHA
mmetsp:Transcript_45008/g.115103  ORF Transcript_45008/g.115103 Transcript_45008/m.115103 type:complete len:477 (+) Transcript_45008:147-1577(+)